MFNGCVDRGYIKESKIKFEKIDEKNYVQNAKVDLWPNRGLQLREM